MDLAELEYRRKRLREDLATVGDLRPGSLSTVMRCSGKAKLRLREPGTSRPRPRALYVEEASTTQVVTNAGQSPDESVIGFLQVAGDVGEDLRPELAVNQSMVEGERKRRCAAQHDPALVRPGCLRI